jgi:hypothetical protein
MVQKIKQKEEYILSSADTLTAVSPSLMLKVHECCWDGMAKKTRELNNSPVMKAKTSPKNIFPHITIKMSEWKHKQFSGCN